MLEQEVTNLKYTTSNLQRALTPKVTSGWSIKLEDLWNIFGVFAFENEDMQHIIEKNERLPFHERATTESLIAAPRFREWMVSPKSMELLVQGEFSSSSREISPFSVFCSTLGMAFRGNQKFISLIHHCGLHADNEDPESGPWSMMMSFIAQLLCQWDIDTSILHQHVDLSWVEYYDSPDISNLCDLFTWLVRQLPEHMTVFCVIDGIHAYERDCYVEDLVDALACILDTTLDADIRAIIKVVVTTPCRTIEVREGFHDKAVMLMTRQGTYVDVSPRMVQHKVSHILSSSW